VNLDQESSLQICWLAGYAASQHKVYGPHTFNDIKMRIFNLCHPSRMFLSIRNGKGKAIPLQAWTGPEGSRKLRLPDFKTIGTWRW